MPTPPPGPVPWIVTLILVTAGVVLALISLPLWCRRVPPNKGYGVRLPATFADESVWYDTNARAGREMFFTAVAYVILVLALPRLAPVVRPELRPLVCVAALVVSVLTVALRSALYARRALQSRVRCAR